MSNMDALAAMAAPSLLLDDFFLGLLLLLLLLLLDLSERLVGPAAGAPPHFLLPLPLLLLLDLLRDLSELLLLLLLAIVCSAPGDWLCWDGLLNAGLL